MERSFYLLCYDISDDKRRVRVARLMESVGDRVQGSVFEAYLDPAELEKLLKKVKRTLRLQEDSLRIYYLCQSCRGKVQVVGQGKVTSLPEVVIV